MKKKKKKENKSLTQRFVENRKKEKKQPAVGLNLKCMEAYTRDVGRGSIRADYESMDMLGVSTGDIVEVIYKKNKIIGKVLPVYPSDEGKEICRLDGVMRSNLGIDIGTRVKIKKTIAVKAVECDVVYVDKQYEKLNIDGRYLADALENVGLRVGQTALFPYFGGRVEVKVTRTLPEGNVIISDKTIFKIVEVKEDELSNTPKTIMDEKCPFCKKKIGDHTNKDNGCRDVAELWYLILRIAVKQ